MDWFEGIASIYVLLINLFTTLDIWLLLTIFFGCDLRLTRKNMVVSACLFLIFNVAVALICYPFENQLAGLQILLLFMFITLGAFCLAKKKRVKALVFSIPALVLDVVYGQIFEMLDTLFGLETIGIEYDGQVFSPFKTLSDIVIFVILLLVLRKCKRQKWSLTLTVGEGIGILFFGLFSFFLQTVFEIMAELADSSFYQLFGCLIIVLMNMGLIYAIMHRKLAGYYKNVSSNYKEQFEEEYSYFQEYKDKQQDTAQFRHDWQNHMLVLGKMLQDGEYVRAEEYFAGLSGMSGITTQKLLTGNEMLDILLCIKEGECRKENITVSMEGTLSELTALRPVDSSILFSNLLDNAIEANRKVVSDRFIRICARRVNEAIYFEMENPMEGELQYEGTQVITTKEASEEHGLGLKNVAEIVKKYQGQYHIEGKDNLFTIQIIFPVES